MKISIQCFGDLHQKGVYVLTNLYNNKKYIGSTTTNFKERWRKHIEQLRSNRHPNLHLQSSFNKYGEDNFEFSILEITTSNLERESFYISKLETMNSKLGYNKEININKRELSEESKNKISKTLIEGYKSGRIKSPKGNLKAWNKGKICSNISETRRQIFGSIEVYDYNDKLIVTFRSIQDLVEWSESNIMPNILISKQNHKGSILRADKIHLSIRKNIPYKGLKFKRIRPLHPEMGVAKWVNSGKAEMLILSQAESTLSEGAETTGEV